MAKKIYDIKPPKLVNKAEKVSIKKKQNISSVAGKIKAIRRETTAVKRSEREAHTNKRLSIFIGVAVVLLGVGIYLFFTLPKASIVIWPKVEVSSFQQTIIADKSATVIDTTKKVIPAQYFQVTKSNAQDFPATGNASNIGLSTGTITIYNKYDPATSFTFKAGTHFLSDSGKLFIAPQKIVVPAATKSGSKITPGSVQATIQAVEGGTAYNIAPSNFSVPGLKGTASYYSIYATSTAAMSGGYTGNVKKVTADDIQGAKDVLTQKTTDDAMAALKNQIPSDYVLLNNAAITNVTNASTQTKSGAIADSFNYQVVVRASALAFKKSDLDQFAKSYIALQSPEGKTLLDNSFKMDYSSSLADITGGKETLNLNFSSGFYQNIDKTSLTLSMLGQNANQINQTIKSSLGENVSQIKVNFWPFWVTSAPNNQKAVTIELKF